MAKEIAGVKMYELAEIAGAAGVDRETLLRKIRRGELKAQRIGRKIHVAEEDLQAWLRGQGGAGENQMTNEDVTPKGM